MRSSLSSFISMMFSVAVISTTSQAAGDHRPDMKTIRSNTNPDYVKALDSLIVSDLVKTLNTKPLPEKKRLEYLNRARPEDKTELTRLLAGWKKVDFTYASQGDAFYVLDKNGVALFDIRTAPGDDGEIQINRQKMAIPESGSIIAAVRSDKVPSDVTDAIAFDRKNHKGTDAPGQFINYSCTAKVDACTSVSGPEPEVKISGNDLVRAEKRVKAANEKIAWNEESFKNQAQFLHPLGDCCGDAGLPKSHSGRNQSHSPR